MDDWLIIEKIEDYEKNMIMEGSETIEIDNNKKIEIARQFCQEVKEIAKKYNLPFFVVTDGASATCNNGCKAVKNARDNHIKWEKENGYDPYENWDNSFHK